VKEVYEFNDFLLLHSRELLLEYRVLANLALHGVGVDLVGLQNLV